MSIGVVGALQSQSPGVWLVLVLGALLSCFCVYDIVR